MQGWFEKVWGGAQPGVEDEVDVWFVVGAEESVVDGGGEVREVGLEDVIVQGEGAGVVGVAGGEAEGGEGVVD